MTTGLTTTVTGGTGGGTTASVHTGAATAAGAGALCINGGFLASLNVQSLVVEVGAGRTI